MSSSVRNAVENPCHMCMPMGAIFPFKGCGESMVVIHGSQGCATYMRRHMAEHYNEPVDVASSSITEEGAIYGGSGNLKRALDNVINLYNPALIGVISTCLAETIGEDLNRIVEEYGQERDTRGTTIVPVNTPGYGGTHYDGYWAASTAIVRRLARPVARHNRINVILPNISPADIREIRRILTAMHMEYTIFPDISDTLDSPFRGSYKKIAAGGTSVGDIARMSGAPATIQLGFHCPDQVSPGAFLEMAYGVPLYNLPLPLGLANTDRFAGILAEMSGQLLPRDLLDERGRLLDAMVDSHKYNYAVRLAVIAEPHHCQALCSICGENGLEVRVLATSLRKSEVDEFRQDIPQNTGDPCILLHDTDFAEIRNHCRNQEVRLALGSSDARYLSEQEGISLIRYGYPIHDRVGGQRLLSIGYTGSTLLLDRITNTVLEDKYKHYRDECRRAYYSAPVAAVSA